MNPTDDDLAQLTAGCTSLADIRRRAFEAGWDAGYAHGRTVSLEDEAQQGYMERAVEYSKLLQPPSEIAGTLIPVSDDYYIEHPEEALPHIVLSRLVYREPWEKHVPGYTGPMA
jgi:hypothetical protein